MKHLPRSINKTIYCAVGFLVFAVAIPPLYSAEAPCPSTVPTMQDSWNDVHNAMVADAKARANDIKIVFAGDSITSCWTHGAGQEIWNERYAPLGAINLGISSDNTRNLLWRLQHGVLEAIHPKMVILLIGTNNLDKTPEAVAYGVWANVAFIRKALPDTRVLVQGIFPRENPPSMTGKAPLVNALLARLDDGKMVRFLDFGSKFLKPDGKLDRTIFSDGCHPQKPEGFKIWADSIQPTIDEWLKAPPIANVPPPPSPVGVPADPSGANPEFRNDFLDRHKNYLAQAARGNCDLLFLGDSTIACWDRVQPLAKNEYGPLHWLNFAIWGGRTENILWQLENGELDKIRPKLVVVQVQDSLYYKIPIENVAAGMDAIARQIHQKLPETKVLLLGAFPYGANPQDLSRVKIASYNSLLAKLADGKTVYYLDPGKAFLEADGRIGALPIPGPTHLESNIFERWADAQRATIHELMGAVVAPN